MGAGSLSWAEVSSFSGGPFSQLFSPFSVSCSLSLKFCMCLSLLLLLKFLSFFYVSVSLILSPFVPLGLYLSPSIPSLIPFCPFSLSLLLPPCNLSQSPSSPDCLGVSLPLFLSVSHTSKSWTAVDRTEARLRLKEDLGEGWGRQKPQEKGPQT